MNEQQVGISQRVLASCSTTSAPSGPVTVRAATSGSIDGSFARICSLEIALSSESIEVSTPLMSRSATSDARDALAS